jgi:hypothetical protein
LDSRRSRRRALHLSLILLGTTIVAGTSMLGANLSSLKRAEGDTMVAQALLDALDPLDPSIDGPGVLTASAPASAPENAPAESDQGGKRVAAVDPDAGEKASYAEDLDPEAIVAGDSPTSPGQDSAPDAGTGLPPDTEEYTGTPDAVTPDADLPDYPSATAPFGGGLPAPNRPNSRPSAPIAGAPGPAGASGGGSSPGGGPSGPSSPPESQPIMIAGIPPSNPGPSSPAAGGPDGGPGSPPVIASDTPSPATSGPSSTSSGPSGPASGSADPGPTLAGNDPIGGSEPTGDRDRYSPGTSPGLDVLDSFTLGGRTLIIEFVSSEPGLGFDVLHVDGTAELDYGNIVFAFIDGYQPEENLMYEFLQAQEIVWGDQDAVKFFYGVIDSASTEEGLHAPRDWGFYTQITDDSLFAVLQDDSDGQSRLIDGVNYLYDASLWLDVVAWQTQARAAPDARSKPDPDPIIAAVSPGGANAIPSPGVLMLLLSGVIALVWVLSRTRHDGSASGRGPTLDPSARPVNNPPHIGPRR